jgi:hypothetical protein
MQAEVGRVVEEIEARTSSEVVVCVRGWSSSRIEQDDALAGLKPFRYRRIDTAVVFWRTRGRSHLSSWVRWTSPRETP